MASDGVVVDSDTMQHDVAVVLSGLAPQEQQQAASEHVVTDIVPAGIAEAPGIAVEMRPSAAVAGASGAATAAADWRLPAPALAAVAHPRRQTAAEKAYYSAQTTRAASYAAAHTMLTQREAGGVRRPGLSDDEVASELFARRIVNLTFGINVALFLLKIAAAAYSGSVAVIGSAIDSSMDVFSGSILFVAARLASKRDPVRFPVGKARMEPLAIVIFACVMCMAALQLFVAAVENILAGVTDGPTELVIDALPLAALAAAVLSKSVVLGLAWRYRSGSASVAALQKDALNDVVTNAAAILAVVVASRVSAAWWLDPAFAMGLAIMIVATWSVTIKAFVYALSGETGASVHRDRRFRAACDCPLPPPLQRTRIKFPSSSTSQPTTTPESCM